MDELKNMIKSMSMEEFQENVHRYADETGINLIDTNLKELIDRDVTFLMEFYLWMIKKKRGVQ